MDEDYKIVRLWMAAACFCVLAFTSCTSSMFYQERALKEAAIAKGMSATEVSCIWQSTNTNCAILASQK